MISSQSRNAALPAFRLPGKSHFPRRSPSTPHHPPEIPISATVLEWPPVSPAPSTSFTASPRDDFVSAVLYRRLSRWCPSSNLTTPSSARHSSGSAGFYASTLVRVASAARPYSSLNPPSSLRASSIRTVRLYPFVRTDPEQDRSNPLLCISLSSINLPRVLTPASDPSRAGLKSRGVSLAVRIVLVVLLSFLTYVSFFFRESQLFRFSCFPRPPPLRAAS